MVDKELFCTNCEEYIIASLQLNKSIMEYDFICPNCKKTIESSKAVDVMFGSTDINHQKVQPESNLAKALRHTGNFKSGTKGFNDFVEGIEVSKMFDMIWRYHNKLDYSKKLETEEGRLDIIRECGLGMFQEVAELVDSFPWKPWRNVDDQERSKDNACREMVDILFFMAWIMRAGDITTDDLVAKFKWVLANNLDRLRIGYNINKGGDSDGQND